LRISELLESYNFHDSLLDNIIIEDDCVTLLVDFCNWMQEKYDESIPETEEIKIIFSKVMDVEGNDYELDSDSILEVQQQQLSNGMIEVCWKVENDIDNDLKIIKLICFDEVFLKRD
jgi:uncharacterized ubiquitin-like protein YukD